MAAEDATARALVLFDAQNEVNDYKKEKERCKDLEVIGNAPESCTTVDDRLAQAEAALAELQGDV
jgi:hypothetical protein